VWDEDEYVVDVVIKPGLDVLAENRKRDVFLTDGDNCYFFPQGWCDDFTVAKGLAGGPDYVDEEDGPQPEIYGYAPLNTTPNSEVDTLFVPLETLDNCREVTEEQAKSIHPALFTHLEKINAEG
jgi:hypothetical protein